ncbi:MAG: TMEM175 family protein [Candidatus Aquilonibacter sp.]
MKVFSTDSNRLEAFSDGVLAVIITIMVLELHAPVGTQLGAIVPALPDIGVYALSFVFIGIYWNNHHHMLRAGQGIDGRAMWANLNLLFWLSLVPFATSWLGENPTAAWPTAFYALLLLLDAIAYTILEVALVNVSGRDAPFAKAVAVDVKGRISVVSYVVAIICAFISTFVTDAILVAIAIMWLVPDRRFEPLIDQRRSRP